MIVLESMDASAVISVVAVITANYSLALAHRRQGGRGSRPFVAATCGQDVDAMASGIAPYLAVFTK